MRRKALSDYAPLTRYALRYRKQSLGANSTPKFFFKSCGRSDKICGGSKWRSTLIRKLSPPRTSTARRNIHGPILMKCRQRRYTALQVRPEVHRMEPVIRSVCLHRDEQRNHTDRASYLGRDGICQDCAIIETQFPPRTILRREAV